MQNRSLKARFVSRLRNMARAVAFGARMAMAGLTGSRAPWPGWGSYRVGPYGVPALPAARGGGTIPGYEQREGYYRVLLDWSPDDIRAAVYTSSTGWLTLAGDLCTAMNGDDRIPSLKAARVMAVQGAPLSFEAAASGRLRRRALKAAQAEEDWWEMLPEAELEELRGWLRFFGVAVGELVWIEPDPADPTGQLMMARIRNGRNVPRLKVWDPRNLRKDLDTGYWWVRTRDGTEELVEPGKGKWILLHNGGMRPWLKGAWRGVAELWLAKKYAREDWAKQSERYADGMIWVTSPEDSDEPERKALAADFDKSGKRPVIIGLPGYEAKILELTARAWETYQTQWDKADRSMSVAILYNDLATESKKSAGTGAQLQGEVRDDVKKADAAQDETDFRAQVLAPWAQVNFGDPELAPWPVYDVAPSEDLQALATTWNLVAQALRTADQAGYDIDWEEVRDTTGLPILGKREPEPVPAALVPFQGGAPGQVPGQPAQPGKPVKAPAPAKDDDEDDASVARQVERMAARMPLRAALEIVASMRGASLSPSEARVLTGMGPVRAAAELEALFVGVAAARKRAVRRALCARSGSAERLAIRTEKRAA